MYLFYWIALHSCDSSLRTTYNQLKAYIYTVHQRHLQSPSNFSKLETQSLKPEYNIQPIISQSLKPEYNQIQFPHTNTHTLSNFSKLATNGTYNHRPISIFPIYNSIPSQATSLCPQCLRGDDGAGGRFKNSCRNDFDVEN
jgi:hypothetical protein